MSRCSKGKQPRAARSLRESLCQFLTPQVWKQGHQAFVKKSRRGRRPRWDLQPLVLTLLTMTWCCGDSQAERFETGKAFCAASLSKRRRPGVTLEGFHKALGRLPVRVLRALAHGVRQQIQAFWDGDPDGGPDGDDGGEKIGWRVGGFIPMGSDGSRLECPRTPELEARLGEAGKKSSAPTVWVTALVHLRLGLLWSWKLGKGTASERGHLQQMLPLLPLGTLLVADAGFNGFELANAMIAAGLDGVRGGFLIRMSAKVRLLTVDEPKPGRWSDKEVYYWPKEAQEKHQPALRVRLIRIRARKKKNDVWLLTNVLDTNRLTRELAGKFYRWRWENEGFFRTYKRTLNKVKLMNRTLPLVHREAEGSLLAAQLLLAQGARALGTQACSARQVLLAVRTAIQADIAKHFGPRQWGQFDKRLRAAKRERRVRTSAKVSRHWPRRGPHKPPKPPRLLKLTKSQNAEIDRLEHKIE
jgi:hypothetical protein